MRIVQAANFVTPTSGGIRTVLDALERGYAALGHEVVRVTPGPAYSIAASPGGWHLTLRAPRVPGMGGYRVIQGTRAVTDVLAALEPDRLEVSDRSTLRGLGRWARGHGVPSVVIAHERLDALLERHMPTALPTRVTARRLTRRLAAGFDTVVATTAWAADEFTSLGISNVAVVPLGVDLQTFNPARADRRRRHELARGARRLLVSVGRLSAEKQPHLVIGAVRSLVARGEDVRAVIVGDGPERAHLEAVAADLPVDFVGYVGDRAELATLLASADVALASSPVETFGLAALEALACGTPVVAPRRGALAELITAGSGRTTYSHPSAMAAAVREVLAWPEAERREGARRRAEAFTWEATVAGMADVHGLGGAARGQLATLRLDRSGPVTVASGAAHG